MINAWQIARDIVLDWEGGWSNDPWDKGRETIFGISRINWPDWDGWPMVDALKSKPDFPKTANQDQQLKTMASDFYYRNFWLKVHGDELPFEFAVAVFDMAVNSGIEPAIRLFQRYLDVLTDGIMGPMTVSAAHQMAEPSLQKFLARRLLVYKKIWEKDPTQEIWAYNWFERITRLAILIERNKPKA